jgi:hypothetical protein
VKRRYVLLSAAVLYMAGSGVINWWSGDWRFRAPNPGPVLEREREGDLTTWSVVFDQAREVPFLLAASRVDRRGRETWRDLSSVRLCVPHAVGGVRVRSVLVKTQWGSREVRVHRDGCREPRNRTGSG